jgi:hypothetical protein
VASRGAVTAVLVVAALTAVGGLVVAALVRSRNLDQWLGGHLRRSLLRRPAATSGPVDLFVCVADHFEPLWQNASVERQRARLDEWTERYPDLARRHRDHYGRPHQHTFFYPAEEYVAEHIDRLADLHRRGLGDVEVHLHHDDDTADNLRLTLSGFSRTLHESHGLLRVEEQTGKILYGFIHGNWALDNSRSDGRFCGVNNELVVLRETGCYADFTFPSAPSRTQTRKVNSIYYATDDPDRPKSHDSGIDVQVGGAAQGDLMIVQGPLTLNWRSRKFGLLPRIESGEISGDALPTPERVDLWVKQHIHVIGRPDWVFLKLHTHGAQERNFEALLGPPMEGMLSYLERAYNDGERYRLHYVTAWEMYQAIKAAERGVVDPAVLDCSDDIGS